ncbi:hypothetical protein [Microbacterium sp. KNMS]
MEKFGRPVRRINETPVRLTHLDGGQLHGTQFYEHEYDVPPLIHVDSVDLTLYRDVWSGRGWAIVSEGVTA